VEPASPPICTAPGCALSPRPEEPCNLRRSVSWRSAVLIAIGTAVLVSVSLGPMAQELGNLSLLVWTLAAGVGALQCLLIAELATRFPDRAGGTALYAEKGLGERSPLLGAVSSWGYWFAWTPGIAVNLILAADYLQATVWPGANTLVLAIAIAGVLYVINSFGLRPSMRVYVVVAALAVTPLAVLVVAPLLQPSLIDAGRLLPLSTPDGGSATSAGTLELLLKWTFVAAWAAYGAEMASTIVAEVRDPRSTMPRAMGAAGAAGVVAFGLVPAMLIAVVGAGGLAEDPAVAFLPAADAVLGDAGGTVLGLTLAAALVLGAHAFIVGSSRTIYQMALDGHLPRVFSRVNRYGVPVRAIFWDAAVITTMLLVFGTNLVNVIAAANVGYLVVFVLLPISYIVLRLRARGEPRVFELPRSFLAIAGALAAFNAVLLVGGGIQWGAQVLVTGIAATLLIVPISIVTRRRLAMRIVRPVPPAPVPRPEESEAAA
jgi:amino acid transporter